MSEPEKAERVVEATPAVRALDNPSCLGRFAAFGIAGLGVLYLLTPTWGVFELIPDNLPIFGNLDEAGALSASLRTHPCCPPGPLFPLVRVVGAGSPASAGQSMHWRGARHKVPA